MRSTRSPFARRRNSRIPAFSVTKSKAGCPDEEVTAGLKRDPGSTAARDVFGAVDADHLAPPPTVSFRTERHERARHVFRPRQPAGGVHLPDPLDHLFISRDLPQRG